MTKPMPDEQAKLSELVHRIRAAVPDVRAIYQFGSFNTPAQRQSSDIDLGLLPAQPLPAADCWALGQELALLAGRDVDLLDLRTASTVMRAQVIAYGRRLYCADESECADFEDHVFSSYARLNEERREILRDIRQRGRIYAG